MINGLSESLGM